ncbi:MAG: type II secretion system protein [Verrucomicrobiales bacterium]|nr:type II secretion system protein [Verrucomicrobiales bacterium]
MKLKLNKKGQAGLTLIEVTLVIAVLLGLISVLFIGVAAYKKGSDRAKCILNIATVQKAVRSYQNLYEKNIGDALVKGDVTGSGKMIETEPTCPASGTYTWGTAVPAASTAYLSCSVADHVPSSIAGW